MARYIKANPKVAKFLRVENDRNQVKDGNYLLWQADMLAFGPLVQLPEILAMIGAIALMPHEAREEQDGTRTRELPIATDERFIIEPTINEPEATQEPETEMPEEGAEEKTEQPEEPESEEGQEEPEKEESPENEEEE